MIQNAEVYLWGTRIGTVHQDEISGIISFEYDKDFIKSNIQISPFKMPLSNNIYTFPELINTSFKGLPGLLADSLPDKFGNAVIDTWLISQGRNPDSFTAIERLCYTGKRGMGALEYVPSNGPVSDSELSIDVNEMVKFASEILSGKENLSYNSKDITMQQMLEFGTSAGGARAKAVIAWNKKTGEVRSGQTENDESFEQWIIKFDGVSNNGDHNVKDKKQYTLVEYAYYLMAKDFGIDMNECRIYNKDGLNHFMTKRFDRNNGNKIHMQTFSALCHYDYNIPCLIGYKELAAYGRRLGILSSDVEQIYRRMVFNCKTFNMDDHVKNVSFLMDRKGVWSLSPAYDLTYAYKPGNKWISKHQMTVNGKNFDITDDDIILAGRDMGLSGQKCKKILEQGNKVVSEWKTYAEKCGINEELATIIDNNIN